MTAIGDGNIAGIGYIRVAKIAKSKRSRWKDYTWELVPTRDIFYYREYDFYDLREPDNVEKIAQSLEQEGWKEPLMLEYYQDDKMVLLGEGNHRLHAARQLGLTHVPVRVWVRRSAGAGRRRGRRSRLPKPISNKFKTDQYIPQELHPSEIGFRDSIRHSLE